MNTKCEILPEMITALLAGYGVSEMDMEWTIKGHKKGQPLTLTLRWTAAKPSETKIAINKTTRKRKNRTVLQKKTKRRGGKMLQNEQRK